MQVGDSGIIVISEERLSEANVSEPKDSTYREVKDSTEYDRMKAAVLSMGRTKHIYSLGNCVVEDSKSSQDSCRNLHCFEPVHGHSIMAIKLRIFFV